MKTDASSARNSGSQGPDSQISARSREDLLREVEGLRRAVLARDEAIAVVAHDLRNPLNVIALAASALLDPSLAAQAPKYAERIVEVTRRAAQLVDDLLDVAAIEAGRFGVETRLMDVSSLVLGVVQVQNELAARASIITSVDLSPELSSVIGDRERLREVLENLMGNAMKFTSPGGSITVGASVSAGEVVVWVKDTGSGIPPEQLPHLFDRFWQAEGDDRRGAGLGLSICKGIVEAHGGRIWVESAVGVGTTVFFTLPSAGRVQESSPRTPVNILLVDDVPENLIALEAMLDRPDYRFFTARSGKEALRLALREQFAVALLDVAMPEMDGMEVAMQLKSLDRCRDVPILFVTAFEDAAQIHRAYAAGCADYLVKPLDSEIVRRKVAVFANLSRRREHAQP